MDRELIYKIREQLKAVLDEERYQHTLGVEFTSAALAMRYGADVYKAELAGLLHDCAKCYPGEELAVIAKDEVSTSTAKTLHAVCAPIIAQKVYGIDDIEILSAIRWHTTGKADMALLDKIVFVADFIEPCREMITILPEIRRIAFEDLTYAVYKITEETIPYVKMRNLPMDPHTLECEAFLKENGIHDR